MFIFMAFSIKAIANEVSWNHNPYAFQYDMTVYIALSTIDGNSVTDAMDYQIGAFCNGECRGIAERKSSGGHDYLYLRIRSNVTGGETISFNVMNLKDGKVAKVNESIEFCSQQTVGYPSNPFMINARNMYKLIYVVDGIVYKEYEVEYNSVIIPENEPKKEGCTFSGWSEIPETMPASDVKVVGTFTLVDIFKIEPNDLLSLKDFYAKFDGDNWTSKWVFAEGEPERTDFPGVTFGEPDELGYSHVVEIRMDKNNVKGDVTAFTLHLPQLTALYLYGNELRGDLTAFVSELTALKTLDVRANALSGLQAVPESVTTLEKGMQFRKDNAAECMEGLDPVLFYISGHQKMTLPSIITYDLASRSHKSTLLYMMERDNVYAQTYFGMLNPIATKEMTYATAWPQTPYTYEYGQDYELWLRTQDGTVYPAVIRYVMGDADMSGATDVLDVQTTITEILHPVLIDLFNASAANTYTDDLLNVQDVVATVNIVLDNDTPSPASYRVRRLAYAPSATSNRLYVEGEKLYLNNENEVGAIEVTLRGVYADEVSLALSRKDYQLASRNTADGSRHVLYSLSGKTIATGTTALLRLAHGQAEPTDAILSSVDGKALDVMLDATPTAIEHAMTGNMAMRFDGNRLLVSSTENMDQMELSVVSAAGQRLIHIPATRLHAGLSIVDAPIPAGVYMVRIERDGKVVANVKLVKI